MLRRAALASYVVLSALFAPAIHATETPDAEWVAQANGILAQIRTGSPVQRRDAVLALREHVRPPVPVEMKGAILAAVRDVGLASEDPLVREKSHGILRVLNTAEALPLFAAGLSDRDASTRASACWGLRDLGPAAKPAVPALRRLLADAAIADDAVEALSHILGAEANPILIDAYRAGGLDQNARDAARSAFAEHPDPAALGIMTGAFRDHPDAFTALYFERLDRPASAEQFRWALANLKVPEPGGSPLLVINSNVVDARAIAARYLGAKRDPAAFDLVLAAAGDPSVVVRTAATVALGSYADPRAIDTVAARLDEDDVGFSAEGHEDGTLHKAAIAALARINTPEALAALYRRTGPAAGGGGRPPARPGRLQQLLTGFWAGQATAEQFDHFLRLYARQPLADATAAPILADGLRRHADRYRLPADEAAQAARAFHEQVRDADVVPATAPAADGTFTIVPSLTLYRGGFAVYHAAFRPKQRMGYGHVTASSTPAERTDGTASAKSTGGSNDPLTGGSKHPG